MCETSSGFYQRGLGEIYRVFMNIPNPMLIISNSLTKAGLQSFSSAEVEVLKVELAYRNVFAPVNI